MHRVPEEYKNRKLYNIAESMAGRNFVAHEKVGAADVCVTCDDAKIILFATTTCPNCKMAEKFLTEAGIVFEKIYADKNPELAVKYDIKQAPTLICVNKGETEKYASVVNVKKFISEYK